MFTEPMKSSTQQLLEIAQKRIELSADQEKTLHQLTTGYKGELRFFNELKEHVSHELLEIYNLYLKVNGSHCQIDCLLIFQNEIWLLEMKHYQGDFYIEQDNWYTAAKQGIKNPLHQLQRTELMTRGLLNEHNLTMNIRSFVVFTNPDFHAYQSTGNLPIVFPGQLNRFIHRIQNTSCRLQERHRKIALLLKAMHQSSSPLESKPIFNYNSLRKGIVCHTCNGFMVEAKQYNVRCTACGILEPLQHAMIRMIREYRILFPQHPVTINSIRNWTDNTVSIYRTRKIIETIATLVKRGKNSYYLLNEDY